MDRAIRTPAARFVIVLLVLCSSLLGAAKPPFASAQTPITSNAHIIQLVKTGTPDSVIINRLLQSSAVTFDLSQAGIASLKKENVSDKVISAMRLTSTLQGDKPLPGQRRPPSSSPAPKREYSSTPTSESSLQQRIEVLEKELQSLRAELAALRAEFLGRQVTVTSPPPASSARLQQQSAESAIRTFASKYPTQFRGGGVLCPLSAIASVDAVSQFSESEATAIVALRCSSGSTKRVIYTFQRDVNYKWFLTKIDMAPGEHGYMVDDELIEALRAAPRVPVP